MRKIPILLSQEPPGHTEEWRLCPTHFQKQKLQEWSKADPDVAQSQSHLTLKVILINEQ